MRAVTGEVLRRWRLRLRLTQTQAGARLGVSLRQYQRLENASDGEVNATLALLFNYVEAEK
jgi:transcriptional regulator with XRE-family HTH domain